MATARELSRPLFIVGQARSGSSILYRLVQAHPSFRFSGGANLSESHVMDVVAGSGELGVDSMRAFAGVDGAAWDGFVAALGPALRRRRRTQAVPVGALVRWPALWAHTGRQQVVRDYLELAAGAHGALRLVEKTPHHLRWARHLVRTCPDAQLLCITRHPVAALASFRRRAHDDPAASWAAVSTTDFVARWAAEAALITRWVDELPSFRLVRYEDLVADPEAEQRALFTWLGEAPLAALPQREVPSPHAPPSEAERLFGEIAPPSLAGPTLVEAHEAEQVEAELAPAMARLGYKIGSGA